MFSSSYDPACTNLVCFLFSVIILTLTPLTTYFQNFDFQKCVSSRCVSNSDEWKNTEVSESLPAKKYAGFSTKDFFSQPVLEWSIQPLRKAAFGYLGNDSSDGNVGNEGNDLYPCTRFWRRAPNLDQKVGVNVKGKGLSSRAIHLARACLLN